MWNCYQILGTAALKNPDVEALVDHDLRLSYKDVHDRAQKFSRALNLANLSKNARVAVYLDKGVDSITCMFGTWLAGKVHVPINPLMKPQSVGEILKHSGAEILVTSSLRRHLLTKAVPDLAKRIIFFERELIDSTVHVEKSSIPFGTENDLAAILYTSGSTGSPKGVALSHRNIIAGAESVVKYLSNSSDDRIISVLPLSFDAGLSQITTSFLAGACCVLHNYISSAQLLKVLRDERITGITAVPPLYAQICFDSPASTIRYFASTGGALSGRVLAQLRDAFPNARPYLMYGLTEAFRATYLDPDKVSLKPHSVGRAIPNARVRVVRSNGEVCGPHEVGEIVQSGPTVALGYWNDLHATALKFRESTDASTGLSIREVWSGDQGYVDEDGDLYVLGRLDDIFKWKGYRLNIGQIEGEAVQANVGIECVAVWSSSFPFALWLFIGQSRLDSRDHLEVKEALLKVMPHYMLPTNVVVSVYPLPRSANGKFDRGHLRDLLERNESDNVSTKFTVKDYPSLR